MLVDPPVAWSIEGGRKHALVAQTASAAVDGKLFVVNGYDDVACEPERLIHVSLPQQTVRVIEQAGASVSQRQPSFVPNAHVAKLSLCDAATLGETMQLAQKIESILQILYKPDGMNYGINLGRAAGAGVTGHLHMHALPRWIGDANFMTVTAETRLHAETIPTTYKRFREAFAALGTK